MASVTLIRLTPPTSQKGFNCFYPSDNCLRLNKFNKLTWFSLILTLLLHSPIELTSLRHQLHIAPRFLICFPKRKIELLGQKAIKNELFCQYLSDNCSIENKRNLESTQIEAARIITGATKLCSIQKLYDDTGIQTLQKRRNNHKLFQLYKILNGLTPQYLQSLIPQRVQNISRYQLRNMNNFNVPPARTVTHANSFLPSTLRDWNSLDLIVRNTPTLNSFKRQLNQTRNENLYPKYFDIVHTSRSGQIYHSRLRLECSSLKYHLYTKNIVQESRCSCGAIETTSHYLLSCDLYRNQRLRYLYLIPQPLSVPNLLFGIPEATLEENNFIFKQVQLYILATKRFAMPSS